MTEPATTGRSGSSDWTLMHAQHDAFRRDLDGLLASRAGRTAVRARWAVFRDQLRFHHTAEDTAMWPPVRARLTGGPAGLASWASQGAYLDSDPGPFFPITASGPAP